LNAGRIVFYAFPQEIVDLVVEWTGGRPITVALPNLIEAKPRRWPTVTHRQRGSFHALVVGDDQPIGEKAEWLRRWTGLLHAGTSVPEVTSPEQGVRLMFQPGCGQPAYSISRKV
jgi:hypothetical protein